MKKLTLVLFSFLLFTHLALADETGGKFGIGVKGGVSNYYGDIDDSPFAGYYDVNLQYWFTDNLGVGFIYGKGYLTAEKGADFFKTDVWNYTALLRLKIFPASKLNPYLTAGFEYFDIYPKGKNGHGLASIDFTTFEKINSAIPVGFGFSYFLTDYLAIDTEALLHLTGIDNMDGLKKEGNNDNFMTLAAGVSLYLGKAKDTDGDGIPDMKDKDPLHAEDFDNFQDEDGAPDLDNDMDGVPDQIDKAPNDPEDRDGFEDADGVPDLDNDKDGILDVNDKAPNEAEDKDGYMDEDGAPDPDNDNDGILDVDDKCPNEAETMNGYEDADGCPDTKPEIAVEKGQAIVLDGVNFATGSAKLTPNSKTILDKVVRTMTQNPDLEVEVRGYTDNTGSYSGNMKISKRRAESVKAYLVENGIDAARISAVGFGPEDPIAPNDTRDGRAQNRRIEFFRVK